MAQQQVFQHEFPNGLTLLGELLPHVRSATLYFLIPAGYVHEPAERLGLAGVLAETITRGAGNHDSKQLAKKLDNLGADRSEGVGAFNVTLSAGLLARNVAQILPLYADIVRRPWLPEEEVEPAVELSLQDLQGLDDSPSDLCLLELKRRYYPAPYGRNQYGTEATLEAIEPSDVKAFHDARFRPKGAILSIAGNIDFPSLVEQVGSLFGDWTGASSEPKVLPGHVPTSHHVTKDTNQTQIAVAYPTAHFDDPDFYAARAAISVLSGGMSSRLFTEVREKRGLCYSVSASYDLAKDRAAVVCYAGTEEKRAQETLDVMRDVLRSVKNGVAGEELDRVKAGLKTSLIMAQESTSARATSLASEWFYLKRTRPLDEVQAAIDRLTPGDILRCLERYPAEKFTIVTLGRQPLV